MTFLSLKGTLIYGLRRVLFSEDEEGSLHFTDFLYNDSLATSVWTEIPLSKKVRASEVLYISALPQLLYRRKKIHLSLSLLEISEQIVNQLRNRKSKILNNERNHKSCEPDHKEVNNFIVSQLWDEFQIETSRAGWVSFHLSDRGLNIWLKHLNSQLSHLMNVPLAPSIQSLSDASAHAPWNDPQVWKAQYVHARCCCLVKLWNTQVGPCYQVRNDTALTIAKTMSDETAGAEASQMASASATHQVIHALAALLDLAENDLFWIPYRWPSKQYFLLLGSTGQLCQSFERFLSVDLSNFGEVNVRSSAATKSRFQANFTLALIVQKTLKVLLERCLGIVAPSQL